MKNFAVFDVVVDPGSEQELRRQTDTQENKDSSLLAYLAKVEQTTNKKRKISEITKLEKENDDMGAK